MSSNKASIPNAGLLNYFNAKCKQRVYSTTNLRVTLSVSVFIAII